MNKITLFLICLLPTLTKGQLLTIEDALAIALKNNFDIRLAKNDSILYAINERFAIYSLMPSLNAQGTAIFNNNDQKQKLPDGTIKQRSNILSDNLNAALNLNWTLFDGMKMFATLEKSKAYVKLGGELLRNQISETIAQVITSYYGLVREIQQLQAIDQQMSLNEERQQLAEKKLKTGLGAKPELLQATLDLNAQKAARIKQQAKIAGLKQDINLLLSLPADYSFTVADSIPVRKDISLSEIDSGLEKNNPALAIVRQQKVVAEIGWKEIKAQRYPTLSFIAAYNFNRFTNKAVINNFTPLQNRNSGFNYGLTANIPLFNHLRVKKEMQLAQTDISNRQSIQNYRELQLKKEVARAYSDYKLYLDVLDLEEANILLAKENVFISSERFRMGITGSMELRESQKSLADAYDRLIAARYGAKVAETTLLKLKGDLIK